jgi:hypothetical protein
MSLLLASSTSGGKGWLHVAPQSALVYLVSLWTATLCWWCNSAAHNAYTHTDGGRGCVVAVQTVQTLIESSRRSKLTHSLVAHICVSELRWQSH